MKIATILNSHANTDLTVSTVQSIQRWVGPDMFVLIDGATWDSWGKTAELGAAKLQGIYHNSPISPHRNITLGLYNALQIWPDADWFCCTEYDCYFGNDSFKEDLEAADKKGVWVLGNDFRDEKYDMSYLSQMLKIDIKGSKYFLGCCIFLNAKFIRKLAEINFFKTFLDWTNPFEQGYIPRFNGYSFVEHLFPTLADYYGGKLEQLAKWNWGVLPEGNFRRYPMRFIPNIDPETEMYPEMAIAHPVKELGHVFRHMYKSKGKSNGKYKIQT